uniref:Cyclin C-terminal domain-containing protein n=1 Tax=Microcebus murinus TaxID=30608 RepID=A0A8C5Y8B3_MICMU
MDLYHPYRPLLQYVQDVGQEDMLLPLVWRIVNDTYRMDLCLLYPPFMIALACLHVACVAQQKDARQWFWKNFDERKEMTTILRKMPKPSPPPHSKGEQGPNGSQNSSYSQSQNILKNSILSYNMSYISAHKYLTRKCYNFLPICW